MRLNRATLYNNSLSNLIKMKDFTRMILGTAILMSIFIGCEKENEEGSIDGKVVEHTDCKTFKTGNINNDVADTLSCVDYSFDVSENKLTLKHVNTGFNCCPGALTCTVSQSSDTIIIQEFEEQSACDCNCLFDLDIEITGLTAKSYYLKFIEPYCGDQEKLFFEVDLQNQPDGTHCVFREQYPWGMF